MVGVSYSSEAAQRDFGGILSRAKRKNKQKKGKCGTFKI